MFVTAGKHGGTSVGSNPEVVEMLIATIFRDAKDRNIALRTIINTKKTLRLRSSLRSHYIALLMLLVILPAIS